MYTYMYEDQATRWRLYILCVSGAATKRKRCCHDCCCCCCWGSCSGCCCCYAPWFHEQQPVRYRGRGPTRTAVLGSGRELATVMKVFIY